MPLAKYFTHLTAMPTQLFQQQFAKILSGLLLCYLAYLCAQLTWLLVPEGQHKNTEKVAVRVHETQVDKGMIDLSKLKSLNLFGTYQEQGKEIKVIEVLDAPETRLNLKLSGTVASDFKATSAAVIENAGKQETYSPGETITGTRAILESVFNDRVIIKHAGRLETLMLDGFKYQQLENKASKQHQGVSPKKQKSTTKAKGQSARNIVDERENEALSKEAEQLRADLTDDPSKIIDYLNISPKRVAGEVVGYSLMPGKDPAFFSAAGLKSGDVAIQLNGYDLTITSEAAQALSALKEEREVSLLLDRNGDITEIIFSLND